MMGLGAAFLLGCALVNLTLTPALLLSFPAFFTAFECGGFGCLGRGCPRGRGARTAPLLPDTADAAAAADDDAPKAAAARKRRGCGCGWLSVAECTQRWGAVVIVAVVAAAAPFIAQVPQMTTTADFSAMVPRGATASVAFDSLIDDFGSGALAPYQLLLHPAPGAKIASQDFFRRPTTCCATLPTRPQRRRAARPQPLLGRCGHRLLRLLPEPHGSRRRPPAVCVVVAARAERPRRVGALPYELYACALHGCGGLNVSGRAVGPAPLLVGDAGERRQYDDGAHAATDPSTPSPTRAPDGSATSAPPSPPPRPRPTWSTSERSRRSTSRIALALGAANVLDAEAAVMATLPLMAGVTLGVVFILVTAAFRSLVVPLRAVLSISLTLAWVYGFLVAVYQHGLLAWTGIPAFQPAPQGLSWMTPVLSFAVMVGLGLDYDVFLLTRIYEERTNGTGDRASIVRGLVHSGNIITAAGCIMAIAFTGLLINATPALNQLAAALVASVLLDTFVVRTLLPSVMGLLGSWNWWPRRMPPVALGVDWATRAKCRRGRRWAAPAPADAPADQRRVTC